jgi:DNA polymerase-1
MSSLTELLATYREVWAVDTEYISGTPVPNGDPIPNGEPVVPVCLVAQELHSGRVIKLALNHEGQEAANPLPSGADVLHLVYTATAEMGFYLAMGWALPLNVLDLWVERRNLTNGLLDGMFELIDTSLVGTCADYGLVHTAAERKELMRSRILQGFPFREDEMEGILDYCHDDVRMLAALAEAMLPQIESLPQAIHRGRCLKAVAGMEFNGIPVDVELYARLKRNWLKIRANLVMAVEETYNYGCYRVDKKGRVHLSLKGFAEMLEREGFANEWPVRTAKTGRYSMDDDECMKPMALKHEYLRPLREVRKILTQGGNELKYPVGADGRNRSRLKPFSAVTSRSQPPTSENLPCAAKSLRSLLAPHKGEVLITRDWSNAEFGIVAALSQDEQKWRNYIDLDVYLSKAADWGLCGETATKATHKELRNKVKPAVLAGQYGQTAKGMAKTLDITVTEAEIYMRRERKKYPDYQAWLRTNAEDVAFERRAQTVFGWTLNVPKKGANDRRTLNFPAQGNCAEIMRLAACFATERGICVGASVHDAFWYTAPEDCWEAVDASMKECMDKACEAVLGEGYVLKNEPTVIHYPDHFVHEDAAVMWNTLEAALLKAEEKESTRISIAH